MTKSLPGAPGARGLRLEHPVDPDRVLETLLDGAERSRTHPDRVAASGASAFPDLGRDDGCLGEGHGPSAV